MITNETFFAVAASANVNPVIKYWLIKILEKTEELANEQGADSHLWMDAYPWENFRIALEIDKLQRKYGIAKAALAQDIIELQERAAKATKLAIHDILYGEEES